jgi:hypothetical protein
MMEWGEGEGWKGRESGSGGEGEGGWGCGGGTARAVGLFMCDGQSASGAHGRRIFIELF